MVDDSRHSSPAVAHRGHPLTAVAYRGRPSTATAGQRLVLRPRTGSVHRPVAAHHSTRRIADGVRAAADGVGGLVWGAGGQVDDATVAVLHSRW